jgi:hypothetical protein
MLSALAERSGTLDVARLSAIADTVRNARARGELQLRDRHADQRVHLAEVVGLEFEVLTQLEPVR